MTTRWHPSAFVDTLLGPRFSDGHNADERRRARLLVAANLLLCFNALFLAVFFTIARFEWRDIFAPICLAACVLLIGNTWLLRRTGRIDLAGLVLCLIVLSTVVAGSWAQGGLFNTGLMWSLVICLFAPMLMGPRLAALCIGLSIAQLFALYLAHRAGHVFPPPITDPLGSLVSYIAATLFVGIFAWLHDRSRREALASRDVALASVEEGREALAALIENVETSIFSVDQDLKLIAFNSLFDQLSRGPGDPPFAPGRAALDSLPESQHADMRALFARALAGEHFAVERRLELPAGDLDVEILFNPIRRASGEIRGVTVLARNIGERKRAEEELARVHRELARAAHLAGKAEVATDVLHNVGNVLTGLNNSASMVVERLQTSKLPFLAKTVALLPATPEALASFVAADEKGRQIRKYLGMLAADLEREREDLKSDMATLTCQLEHVKSVVARQQAFARTGGVIERVAPENLIGDALRMNLASLNQCGITVTTEVASLPLLVLDRHKLVEILNNFIANSRQALETSATERKRIVVRAFCNQDGNLQIDVADNGIGFAPEQAARLFTYGYTTKPDGHGFGLAGSLLAARSMSGTVRAYSDGPDRGATFTMELPLRMAQANPSPERVV